MVLPCLLDLFPEFRILCRQSFGAGLLRQLPLMSQILLVSLKSQLIPNGGELGLGLLF